MCPSFKPEPRAFTREKLNKLRFDKITKNQINVFHQPTQKHINKFVDLLKEYEVFKGYPKFHEYKVHPRVIEYIYKCAIKEKIFNTDELKKIEDALSK